LLSCRLLCCWLCIFDQRGMLHVQI
jgi:hypothetical protein